MSGALDFLFQGSPPPTTTTYGQQTAQLPAWWSDYAMGILSKASSIAGEQYQTYDQPRVAQPNANMQQAWNNVAGNQGIASPFIQQSNEMLQKAGGDFSAGDFQSYLNPYMTGVVDNIATMGARNLSEKLLPQVSDTFTKAGQFGSSRHEDFLNRALRDTNESVLAQQSDAMSKSYDSAMGAYQKSRDQAGTAGAQTGVLGQLAQSSALKDAAALEGVGASELGFDQKNYDIAYQDFVNQRDYPRKNIEFLNTALHGINAPTSYSSAQDVFPQSYSPSILSQLAGAGTAAASISNLLPKKRGGVVKRPPIKGGVLCRVKAA